MAVPEARDQVDSTQNVFGVEKTKRVPTGTVCELNAIESPCLPASAVLSIKLIKPYPQDINFLDLVPYTRMQGFNPEDTEDTRVLVWVSVTLGECHNVSVCPRVQCF